MIHVPEFVPLAVWDDYYQSLPAARDFLRNQLAQSVGEHAMQRDSERFGRYLAMLRAHGAANANSRLLDIGSYTGAWPRLARAAGVDAHGVEGLAEAVQFAQSREPELPLLHARVEEFDPASFGGAFDVVTMWETLEHTRDPLAALRRAAMALKPGGMLAVSVPNAANPQFTILGSFCFYAYGGYHYTGHINMFSPHTLRKALAACGFDVIEVNSEYGTDWRQVVHYLRRQFDRIHCYRNLLSQGAIATVTEPGLDVILNWLSPALTRLENAWTAGPIMLALARRR